MRSLLLALILVAGLALRLWGIGFDLPDLYHPDEDAIIMPAIHIIKTGDLKPIRMEYGTLHIYVLTAVSAVVFLLSVRDGYIQSVDQLAFFERGTYPAVYPHPEYYLAARGVSAIMGTGVVLLVYLLARRLGNERLGLIAAALAALTPALVLDAHFATTDTPLMFWVSLSLYLLVRSYDSWNEDNMWAYAGAGLVCGLAASTKYNGVILAVPLLLVPVLRVQKLEDAIRMRVLIGPLAMIAGFLIGTPFALLDLPAFLEWFGYSLRLYNRPQAPPVSAWQWHLNYHFTSPHALIFVLGLVGLSLAFYYWRKRAIILNTFVLVLWLAILDQTNYQTRMWLPSAPLFMIGAALSLDLLIQKAVDFLASRRLDGRLAYLPLLLILPLLATSIQYGKNLQGGDVRTLAARWIAENIPAGTPIAGDYFMPNIDAQKWPVTKVFYLFDQDLDWYRERGIEYLVMNVAHDNFSTLPAGAQARYRAFIQDVCLADVVHGPFLAATYLDIRIYKMPPCN